MDNKDYFVQSLHAMMEQEKQEEFAQKPIKVLGEVILLLKAQPKTNIVKFDFTESNPLDLDSYRGYYSDLALDYSHTGKAMTVKNLLAMFESADGRTFTSYKGGDFTMNHRTFVWVAPYGVCGRMLTDIKGERGITTIYTREDV